MWYVYVLRNREGQFYIGSTNNLKRRIEEHNAGKTQTTQILGPFRLEAYVAISDEAKARSLEKYFKTGSGRAVLRKHILQM
jgi:predicted GIY-YIG superfamily endonuclease